MSSNKDMGRRTEDGQRRHSQSHGSQWVESDDDEEPELYCTDDFRMRCMKVLRCSKKYCHDWTRCPFAHPGEKATRRDPMHGIYTGIACPDMRRDQRCPRGHYCPYAHNVFEYWLHPTRYRTALCRDVERCSRKICFFAHEVHEIRTNVERPYVSPQQLVAATEAAALDPRVQAEFQAAKEQSSYSKPGLMTGMFQTLDGPAEGEGYESSSLTLQAPWVSPENQEVSNALSSLMRGAAGPIPRHYNQRDGHNPTSRLSGNFKSLPPPVAEHMHATGGAKQGMDQGLKVRRSLSDPSSRSGASHASEDQPGSGKQPQKDASEAAEPDSGVSDLRTGSSSRGINFWQKDDQLTTQSSTQTSLPVTREEKATTMYPNHLNTMVQMPTQQSWGGQQNLMNAAAHLMDAKEMPGGGLWSTPRGPLENPLYSTSSSVSERQPSLEASLANRLDAVYKQKLRKRQAKRQQGTGLQSRFAYPQPYAPQPPIFSSTPGLLGPYAPGPPAVKDPYSNLPTIPNFWNDTPGLDMAQAYQQQQQHQNQQQRQHHAAQAQQNYLQSMQEMQMKQHAHQQQRQVHAMEQLEAQFQLQQAIELELQKLNTGNAGNAAAAGQPPEAKQDSLMRAGLDRNYTMQPNHLQDFQGQYGGLFPNARLHSGGPGVVNEPALGGQYSTLDSGFRAQDALYGFDDGQTVADPDSYYRRPSAFQASDPTLENIFSHMNLERSASGANPAANTGQGRH